MNILLFLPFCLFSFIIVFVLLWSPLSSFVARGLSVVSCGFTEVVGITVGGNLIGLRFTQAVAHNANDLGCGYLCTMTSRGRICSDCRDMQEWESRGAGGAISWDFG